MFFCALTILGIQRVKLTFLPVCEGNSAISVDAKSLEYLSLALWEEHLKKEEKQRAHKIASARGKGNTIESSFCTLLICTE